MPRHPLLIAALLLGILPAGAQALPDQPGQALPGEPEPVLIQTVLANESLGDDLMAFPVPDGALVPLGELCHLLGLGITVQPGGRKAAGFFITPRRRFSLDLDRRVVEVEGRILPVAPGQARADGGEIFVDARLLGVWFPMKVELSLKASALILEPTEQLPVQAAMELERAAKNQPGAAAAAAGPADPLAKVPYAFLDVPMVDLSLSWDAAEHQPATALQGTTQLSGDALWMSNQTLFTRDDQAADHLARTTFFRQDPGGHLLGPLRARNVEVGDLFETPSLNAAGTLVSGRGLLLDNYPTDFRSTFAARTFHGNLPDGWYVELFQNGALSGIQRSRPDGLYEFPSIPMTFGLNIFRLVFHGPLGEHREETYRLDIADDQPPPGIFYYRSARIKATDPTDGVDGTDASYFTESELGLSKALAIKGAVAQVSRPQGPQQYAELGLRGVFPWLAIEVYGSRQQPRDGGQAGTAGQTVVRSGYGYSTVSLEHGEYRSGFEKITGVGSGGSSGLLHSDTTLNLSHSFTVDAIPCAVSLSRTLDELIGQPGTVQDSLQLSATMSAWSFSNNLTRSDTGLGGPVPVTGQLTATTFNRAGTFQANLGYNAVQSQLSLTLWGISQELATLGGTTWMFGLQGTDSTLRNTTVLTSMNRLAGAFACGLDLSYSTGAGYTIGFRVSTSLAREPRTGHWVADAASMSGQGAISAQSFLDRNGNGRKDPGERVLEGTRYDVGGGEAQNRSTDPATAFLLNVGAAQERDVRVEEGSLEDPGESPDPPGIRFVPRPGKVARLDFPVIIRGELSSTTRIRRNGKVAPFGGVEVELLDAGGKRFKVLRSSYDGYFEVLGLPLGEYTLQVTADEAARLHLTRIPSRKVHLSPEEPIQDGLDLILEGKDADPEPAAPPSVPMER